MSVRMQIAQGVNNFFVIHMATILIDVRTKEEYAERHATNAINIPVEEICDGKLGILGNVARDVPLCLYCRSGARSERAKEKLSSLGYTNVENLGGLVDVEPLF